MTIEKIRRLIEEKSIKWSTHCLEKMGERDISIEDVKHCVAEGEIIEDYPDDFPFPSCLVFGHAVNERTIHVVVGCNETTVYFITVYIPNIIEFEDDLKTRRK